MGVSHCTHMNIISSFVVNPISEVHFVKMWQKGTWYNSSTPFLLYFVEDEKVEVKPIICLDFPEVAVKNLRPGSNWEFGDFGPARKEIVKATGVENYNWKYDLKTMAMFGVVHNEGKEICTWGMTGTMETITWLNQEELQKLDQKRDSADAPESPYEPREKGKLIWFSGPPGSGKSTTAQILARKHEYVYYEADAFSIYCNPFVDPNADNPTLAAFKQTPLKVISAETI